MKVFKPLAEGAAMSQSAASPIPTLPSGAVLRLAHGSGFRYRFGDSNVVISQGSQGISVPASGGNAEIYLHPEDGATHVAVSVNDVNLSYGYLL